MRPLVPILLAVAAAVALAAPAQARPPARAVLVACERSSEDTERAGVFEGQMRALAGASRMQMRFTLQARTPERRRWTRVDAPGFGTWVGSAPGTTRYVYTKRVESLLAPASYRVRVSFRWLDAAGAVVARDRRYSGRCHQPDPRADLVVRSLSVQPVTGAPTRRRYVALVRNTGRRTAERSALALTVGGTLVSVVAVPSLGPGGSATVTVEGPACEPGAAIVADADSEESVDERDEADNRLTLPCAPASA